MQYLESLRYLQRRDDWERTASAADAARWDLRRMRALLARLGEPHLGRGTVHVAGSKGKGSIATMVAAVLTAAGVRTGLYSKPHLHRFVERIAIDGEPLAAEEFGRLAGELAPHLEAQDAAGPGDVSTFEALVALAFLAFREREAGWQVLEVGLGGRLDATNVFEEKAVCVIAPVGLEHTAVLGDTVAQIAGEKAAIITPGSTVIMAPQREAAAEVVRRVCRERGATLVEVAQACAMRPTNAGADGQEFVLKTPQATRKLNVPLLGAHQLANAATAVLAVEALDLEIDDAAVREGLASVRLPARIEVLKRRPYVIADGAHNRDSARALVTALRDQLGLREATFVVGCSGDKDVSALVQELAPMTRALIATRSRHPRALSARALVATLGERGVLTESGLPFAVEEPVGAAIDAARAQGGAVVATGSLFVAAEAREHILGVSYDPPLAAAAETTAR